MHAYLLTGLWSVLNCSPVHDPSVHVQMSFLASCTHQQYQHWSFKSLRRCYCTKVTVFSLVHVMCMSVGCSGVGRVQSFISQLLYVTLGEAEQPLSTVPAGVGRPANWKIIYNHETVFFILQHLYLKYWYMDSLIRCMMLLVPSNHQTAVQKLL